ncbi:M3 family oligoendopeptidase [Parachlamydia sp. AcF125]|uniref:M3 family oligoendopeptidase n=1 Tax=Parachlamydia sp. AcF125 TaxID=2795736 RepID=UPI001BC9B310|nr:M3 family oligoendopeptidase [Parachlamydia sp. AcF125]MBS4169278.1 Oligoendopeptidase F, plasmid [Parachlamydia sp. AcF125]
MPTAMKPLWNLNTLYPKIPLSKIADNLMQSLQQLGYLLSSGNLLDSILSLQEVDAQLSNALSYASCLIAQNTHDQEAIRFNARLQEAFASFQNLNDGLNQQLAKLSKGQFRGLLKNKDLLPIQFILEERRLRALEKLPLEQEALIHDLAVDGFHGWYQLYQTQVGKMRISCTIEGEKRLLSVGQAYNQLTHADRKTRSHVFSQWTKAWDQEKEILAQILNHISGFRSKVYEKRGWNSYLKEALNLNRLSEKTLTTMWQVVTENKAPFLDYLKVKAKLLKQKKLAWHDLAAPLGKKQKKISYTEGFALIEEHFQEFSPSLGRLATQAKQQKWVEAEDRPGKSPGGFCTSFPLQKQSRIFMTYSNTLENLMTLAHELGHAYHSQAVFDLPPLAQSYPMSLAETASTFAEQILSDALLKKAYKPAEKLFLLDQRLQRSSIFFLNIHSRFLFESELYIKRKHSTLSAEELCELMQKAQQTAFCDSLSEYHPYFWAEKLHFYLTELPFYNFPYAFGYLFSMGIYAMGRSSPKNFAKRYHSLLQDTGRMSCEEVAKKHLDVDLTTPDFWQSAIQLAIEDVSLFAQAAKQSS